MGYRSDVVVGIEFPTFKECLEFYAMLKASSWDCLVPDIEVLNPKEGEPAYMVFAFWDVKWYEGYDLPTAMRAVLDLVRTKEYPYRFVRTGEEYNDEEVEEAGGTEHLEEMIYIERVARVEVDFCSYGTKVDDIDAALRAL